jgi:hypothetical protein
MADGALRRALLGAEQPQGGEDNQRCPCLHGNGAIITVSQVMEPPEIPREGAEGDAGEVADSAAAEPMLWCPVCSARLAQRKCKLFCEKCGYYMSCADYY